MRQREYFPSLARLAENPLSLTDTPPADIDTCILQIATEFFDKMALLTPPDWLGRAHGYRLPLHLGAPPRVVHVSVVRGNLVFSSDDESEMKRVHAMFYTEERNVVLRLVWVAMHQALWEEVHGDRPSDRECEN
jgi:hypothetical protein